MSISRLSLNFCFCRLLMMENAMAMVSSCMRRLVSTRGRSSPLMRSTGCEPTFRWRSEALRSDAIFRRSLMCIGFARYRSRIPDRTRKPAFKTTLLSSGGAKRRVGNPRRGFLHVREPAELVGDAALDHVEERLLQGLRDLATGAPSDRDLVDGADGGDLGR